MEVTNWGDPFSGAAINGFVFRDLHCQKELPLGRTGRVECILKQNDSGSSSKGEIEILDPGEDSMRSFQAMFH